MIIKRLFVVSVVLFGLGCSEFSQEQASSTQANKVDDSKTLIDRKNEQGMTDLSDGPYVFFDNQQLNATWFCQQKLTQVQLSQQQLPVHIPNCNYPVTLDRLHFKQQSVLEYQGDFKIAATSDFHGQYDLMMSLLKNNHIVDENERWAFGDGHYVITGDVFDRGDKVTEILWFLYRLEKEAEQVGGKLHLLLGNHEVMILNGDLRYLHPKYVEMAKKLNRPFEELFAKNTVLGDWLRSKAVLVKINDMLFAHGGFHPSLAQEKRTLTAINQVFKENLVKSELPKARSEWGNFLHKSNGPIWYRGYFKDNGASSAEIDLLLAHFDIKHLVVGHTSQEQVETRYQGRVIAIDSSIKRGEYGELLLIEGDNKWRGKLDGKREKLH